MLILASASPRRAELLRQVGLPFKVCPANIDESVKDDASPRDYVTRLAQEKARVVFETLKESPVLGSDTAVVLGDKIFGKPRNYENFVDIMSQLSGATHQVISSVAIVSPDIARTAISVTEVSFRHLSKKEIRNYWQTEEPKDKAGGYAIQGFAAGFIENISGSYSGVMGLPLFETLELLRSVDLWEIDRV